MAFQSKKAKKLAAAVDREKLYGVTEAIALAKEHATAKFDETIEVALNLGVDPRHADQMVRGVVSLPKGTGKTVRVAVFAKDAKAEEAKAAGADVVGADDLIEQITNGNIDFDRCIATPDMMGLVGRVAKILGPKGMMPNPKLGTVTPNVGEAVKAAKGGTGERPDDDPGWFFVIKERPGEPRFGLDAEQQPTLSVWNDLSWPDVQPKPPGAYIEIATAPVSFPLVTPSAEDQEKDVQHQDDKKVGWSRDMNAAELAYILFQAPVLVAVHAAEMLPK